VTGLLGRHFGVVGRGLRSLNRIFLGGLGGILLRRCRRPVRRQRELQTTNHTAELLRTLLSWLPSEF
jgi:hypothetical protein